MPRPPKRDAMSEGAKRHAAQEAASKRSKLVVDQRELSALIRETIRSTLYGHANADAPKGYTIAATRRGPELMPLQTGELEATLQEIGNNVAATMWANGIEIDFDSDVAEEDPSAFVLALRDAWQDLKKE